MTEYIYQELIDYTMSGMEDIAGFKGHHWIRDTFQFVNNNYLKPLLVNRNTMKQMDNTKIVRMFERLQLQDARDLVKGQGDLGKNQIFVQALIDHTRSRSNTLGDGSQGFTSVDVMRLRDLHGVTVYENAADACELGDVRTSTFSNSISEFRKREV
ncbi:unnamed protein product [Nippostrongylus brasiliensis]|uniref:SAM domain-containing protein n=1 Tax=Nippostrongylus brasiliensis TaxID=27835 RepID=A0A0N4YYH3_NIPBR|nr:unnamed protein product [Nippostrongylus brasiliensis]